MTYFPFVDYWWFYLAFIGFVFLLLALDLGVFNRKAHVISVQEASMWSVVWVSLALLFNFGFYRYAAWKLASIPGIDGEGVARQLGLEFLTGYVVEKTLSLDNIFVFVVVFAFFGVPALYQHRVLFYGIAGALLFRAVFIFLGSALLQYHWILWLFGGLLMLTGVKMMFTRSDTRIDPESNPLIRLLRRVIPVTKEMHGDRFLVRTATGWQATPLLVALLFLEASDVLFAVDSVPAIFALTQEPLIVFTSNVLAILGLRSLYFVLASAVERFTLLKYGLAFVLIFIGLKMVWLNDAFGGKFPISWSLGIIGGAMGASIVSSLFMTRLAPTAATLDS